MGKGTLAHLLAGKRNFIHLSTGDILREEVKKNTPLGQKVRGYMTMGELVPDEVLLGVIEQRLKSYSDNGKGFVFDGFPRTIDQAEGLKTMLQKRILSLDQVILLEVPEGEIIRRLSSRKLCRNCGANYNLISRPPKIQNVCDLCGGEIYQREDDREETIKKRLRVYQQETQLLIDYYNHQGILTRLNGEGSIAEVFQRLLNVIKV